MYILLSTSADAYVATGVGMGVLVVQESFEM